MKDTNNKMPIVDNNQVKRILAHNEKGQFITRICPNCGAGTLQKEFDGCFNLWRCNGLKDIDIPHIPLQACTYFIYAN